MLGPQLEISKMTTRQSDGDLCADAQQRGRQPGLGAYSFVLRGTFIEVVGEGEEEAEEGAHASRRARSDPGSRGSGGESASAFGDSMAYVERLAERHSLLWGEAGSKSSRSSNAEDTSAETSGMTPVTTSDGQDGELPATPISTTAEVQGLEQFNMSSSIAKDTGTEASGMSAATTFDGQDGELPATANITMVHLQGLKLINIRSSSAEDTGTEASGMSLVTTLDEQDCELPATANSTMVHLQGPKLINIRSSSAEDAGTEASGMSAVTTLDEQDCELPTEASGMSLVTTLDEQDGELPATANNTMVHLQDRKLTNISSSIAEDTSTEASGMSAVTTLDEQDGELSATANITMVHLQGLKLINIGSSIAEDTGTEASGMSPMITLDAKAINTIASHADQLSGVAGSSGSVGHPELCSRPCAYFAQGKCKSGEACNFCHLPHAKRPAHLDKAFRAEFHDLPFQEIVSLVLPVLKRKVASLDSSLTTMALFSDLASACGVAVVEQLRTPARQHRRLLGILKAMSLRTLLATAGPALSRHRPEIDGLATALEHCVRVSVVSAGGAPRAAQQLCQ